MSEDKPEQEQLLQFPCSFPIKVMGRDENAFKDTVVQMVQKHTGSVSESDIRVSPSRKGNFVSVTITINAESQKQLDDIYGDLSACDDVLFSL
jgi:putative lipoic acid-binding regulatory protein